MAKKMTLKKSGLTMAQAANKSYLQWLGDV
jgi:hypothetical protein